MAYIGSDDNLHNFAALGGGLPGLWVGVAVVVLVVGVVVFWVLG